MFSFLNSMISYILYASSLSLSISSLYISMLSLKKKIKLNQGKVKHTHDVLRCFLFLSYLSWEARHSRTDDLRYPSAVGQRFFGNIHPRHLLDFALSLDHSAAPYFFPLLTLKTLKIMIFHWIRANSPILRLSLVYDSLLLCFAFSKFI